MKKLLALLIAVILVLPSAVFAATEVDLSGATLTMGTNSTDAKSEIGKAVRWNTAKDGIISEEDNKVPEVYATYSIHPNNNESAWIIIDMGEGNKATFTNVQIYKRLGWDSQAFSKGYIYISDDGEKWSKSDLAEASTKDRYADIAVSFGGKKGSVSARYIKVEATQVGGGDGQPHWGFEEIRLMTGSGSPLTPAKTESSSASSSSSSSSSSASSQTGTASKTETKADSSASTVSAVQLPGSAVLTLETDSSNASHEVGISARWNTAKDGIVSEGENKVNEVYATYSIYPEKNESAWMTINLGEYATFSGVRIYNRLGWVAQAISKAYLYVSDDGVDWMKSDLITLNFKDRYSDIPASFGGNKINVKASFIKLEAVQVGANDKDQHWGFEEIQLLSSTGTDVKEVSALSAYKAGEKEKIVEVVKKDEDLKDDTVLSDRSAWVVTASSEENPIKLAFDGKTDTFWHSDYTVENGSVVSHDEGPFDINITLPSATLISGMTFVPRGGSNTTGIIRSYEVYGAETDDGEFVLLTSGRLTTTGEETVKLYANVKVKKLLLKVNGQGGYGAMAEFYLVSERKSFKTVAASAYLAYEEQNKLYEVDRTDFTIDDNCDVWAGHEPSAMLDGSTGTFWQTVDSGFPYVIDIDMKKEYAISEITYVPRLTNDNHGSWQALEILVSNDGESFTKAYEAKDLKVSTDKKFFTFDKPVKARYWRFNITNAFASRASCSELAFYCSKTEKDRIAAESKEQYVLAIDSNVIKVTKGSEAYEKTLDVSPFIYGASGTTLIPLRGLLEEMGSVVSWAPENETITIDGDKITMQIQDELVYVKDSVYGLVRYTLRVAPMIKDSRTFIPLRFVSEQLGYDVSWNGETREITITK